MDLYKDSPVELCNRLLSGRLDISPVPAIEYARHAGELLLLPRLTVGSNGRVMSIIIVSKVPVGELDGRPFALANTSRTSQVLARIILKEKYGVEPQYFESPPDLPEMFREADGALLIGDAALRVFARPGKYHIYDLGEAWKALTGEKMVYAVWAVRKVYAQKHPKLVNGIFRAFEHSLDMSVEHLDEIAGDIARWETFSKKFLKDYFSTLRYEFGEDYQRGFLKYLEKARGIGAIKRIPKLRFVEVEKSVVGKR